MLLLGGVAPGRSQGTEHPDTLLDTSVDILEEALEMERQSRFTAMRAPLQPSEMTPFTTDGCSGGLSVGWEYLAAHVSQFHQVHGDKVPWEECCIRHDRAYHLGGAIENSPEQSFTARKRVDLELHQCVLATGISRSERLGEAYNITARQVEDIYLGIAHLMYRAVRIGGMPCTGLPWRWGYGWPECD